MEKVNGRYVEQPGGYRAFIPGPLPPQDLSLADTTLSLLSRADLAVGRLDGVLAIIPDADRFISLFVLREAVLSSQIEGTQASLADVLEYEARMPSAVESLDIQEVLNYVGATHRGIELLQTLPLSARLIKDVHAVLMHPSLSD